MTTFKVTVKRVQFSQVEIDAPSAAEARRMLADDETAYEYWETAREHWYGPEIKVVRVEKEPA